EDGEHGPETHPEVRRREHDTISAALARSPDRMRCRTSHAMREIPAHPGRLPAMLLKMLFALLPIRVTEMMQTTAMSESMSAYSTIVAASSFLTKWRTREVMRAIASSRKGWDDA